MALLRTLVCLAALMPAVAAFAHNPDTSYARLRIAPDEFSATFIYDVTSLLLIEPLLDSDGDRSLSPAELQAAVPRIEDFLRRSIRLEVDAAPKPFGPLAPVAWPLHAGPSIAERDYHAATSLVTFTFLTQLPRPPVDIWVRFEFFGTLGGHHTILAAFAHDGRDEPVIFTEDEPDFLFETGFPSQGRDAAALVASHDRRSSSETAWTRAWRFCLLGVEHILVGYDHVLFLLALIVVGRPREFVGLVTAFTIAHSITLALATLGWVALPTTLVESCIAATIVFTALENLWIKDTAGRWRTTFAFGLIHGFGFAGVLRDLGLPADGFLRSLLAFNVGVELGQLAIVALLAWPAVLLARWRHGPTARRLISLVIAACGAGWLIDRLCGLALMPF